LPQPKARSIFTTRSYCVLHHVPTTQPTKTLSCCTCRSHANPTPAPPLLQMTGRPTLPRRQIPLRPAATEDPILLPLPHNPNPALHLCPSGQRLRTLVVDRWPTAPDPTCNYAHTHNKSFHSLYPPTPISFHHIYTQLTEAKNQQQGVTVPREHNA
jgi:hypothetical protein